MWMKFLKFAFKAYQIYKAAQQGKEVADQVLDVMADLAELTPTKLDDKGVAQLRSVDKEIPDLKKEAQALIKQIWK